MTYWLVLSTLSWAASFGMYADKSSCEAAAKDRPWYVSASCVPIPAPNNPQEHKH
jgi:hypothetical protein